MSKYPGEPWNGRRREKCTLVNSETLARDRALINRQDARALIDFAVVVLVITPSLLVTPATGRIVVFSFSFSI